MSKKYILEIKKALDGSDDFIIELPQELLDEANLKENDVLGLEVIEGKIIMKKVGDFSKEETIFLEKLNQNKDLFSADKVITRSGKYK